MPTLVFYADTLSQWSVVSPLLSTIPERFKIEIIAGPPVAERAKQAFPDSIHHATFVQGENARSIYPLLYFTKQFNYETYRTHRSLLETRLRYYANLLARSRASAVVVGEDGISGEIWLVRAARTLGIPVFILPYEASGKEDFINVLRAKKRENNLVIHTDRQQSFLKSIGESKWLTTFEGETVSIYGLEYITALHDVGFRIPEPWTTHGGEADILLSESFGMTAFYKDEGLPAKKLKQTGSPYDDAIASQFKVNVANQFAYDNCTKISREGTSVLVSLPPDYDSERSHLSDFESYAAMCQSMQSAFGVGVNKLTIMVHPAYHSQEHAPESGGTQIEFSRGWVLNSIPAHDIYLTCGSSTLRWAVAARKAAINFDFYRFQLKFFDRLPGLKQFEESNECFGFVRKLTDDHEFYSSHIQNNAAEAQQWAYLDGQCSNRILAAISDTV